VIVRVKGAFIAVTLTVMAFGCTTSHAQAGLEPGVHVDPGSPAAKQYALPLGQARHTGQQATGGNGPEPAFGAGIKPDGGGPNNSGHASAGNPVEAGHPSGKGSYGSATATAKLPSVVLHSEASRGSQGGSDSILVLLGGGVVILVVGGFLGTVLRRSRTDVPVR
jgi:hypothetical protein